MILSGTAPSYFVSAFGSLGDHRDLKVLGQLSHQQRTYVRFFDQHSDSPPAPVIAKRMLEFANGQNLACQFALTAFLSGGRPLLRALTHAFRDQPRVLGQQLLIDSVGSLAGLARRDPIYEGYERVALIKHAETG